MELTIEKLVYGGDGLARLAPDEQGRRKTVFVPLVLPGERVDAEIVEDRPAFARAQLKQVLDSAPFRILPLCPYFARCGGCHYQQASYEDQLRLKGEILRETLARIAKLEVGELATHASPAWNYRNRTRLHVRNGAGKFEIGYHRLGSHALEPVRECPISSPLINRALAQIWKIGEAEGFPEALVAVELFATNDDTGLLVQGQVDRRAMFSPARFKPMAEGLRTAIPELRGVVAGHASIDAGEATAAPELSASSAAGKPLAVFGEDALPFTTASGEYRVSAGSFFQTNRFLTDTVVELVTRDRAGKFALDLYAGVGLFSLPLARQFERVVAVESAPRSAADLKHNAPPHVQALEAATEHYLERGSKPPDYVVVDPPRAGLGRRVAERLGKLFSPQLTYVSCDPSTLARDLPVLLQSGYRIQEAHLVDLFPQTFHIESVFRLAR
ncbi:MAG TPA: 23S rRNA (uracil(1939)-C(5))-methyltransferase RlmD [Terriglobales bacterium]|nr:23S rRNA (uracil(1939)-C(5))-methyltransferase RlmD [Terriglobales bacterium]